MKIRFGYAASAVVFAAIAATPALASDQTALAAAGANMVVTDADGSGEISGVTASALTADGTPITIKATSAGMAPTLVTSAGAAALAMDSAAVAAAVQASTAVSTARSESFTVVLNQDSFFGFYPTFTGLIPLSEKVDLSFYGILWTTSDFSSATGLGSDLWTEFGIGANFHAADGNLMIKPQIGITNGALLSRGNLGNGPLGTTTTLNGGNVFDGIVPSLTMNYSDEKVEAEFYGGYYAALRNRNADVGALDFLHAWINAGYKFTSNFSAGAHFEVLANTRVDLPNARASNVYQWYGPYVQFSLSNGFFARFTGGAEEGGGPAGNRGDFYKLAVGFSF